MSNQVPGLYESWVELLAVLTAYAGPEGIDLVGHLVAPLPGLRFDLEKGSKHSAGSAATASIQSNTNKTYPQSYTQQGEKDQRGDPPVSFGASIEKTQHERSNQRKGAGVQGTGAGQWVRKAITRKRLRDVAVGATSLLVFALPSSGLHYGLKNREFIGS